MFRQFRPNLFLANPEGLLKEEELLAEGITAIVGVGEDVDMPKTSPEIKSLKVGLLKAGEILNPPYMKDLVCHAVKTLLENGEGVVVLANDPLSRGAFVVCRVACEIEHKILTEVIQELKQLEPELKPQYVYY